MKLTQFCKNNAPALGIWTDRGIVDVMTKRFLPLIVRTLDE